MESSREYHEYIELRNAIKKKDKVKARKLLLKNDQINAYQANSSTPLHLAIVKFDDVEIMTMLLDRGANIYLRNGQRHNPLEVAIRNNKTEAAILLMKRGALSGEILNPWLLLAIEHSNCMIVKNLIDHRTSCKPLIDLKPPLNAAISRGHPQIIEYILPHCQFLEPCDKYIPREVVIKSGQQFKESVELLLEWNFTVNPTSSQDEDFIFAAVEKSYLPIVLQLLNLVIDVSIVDSKTGISLLKMACLNGHHEIVENLLKHDASVNVTTPTDTVKINSLSYCYYDKHGSNHQSIVQKKNDLKGITCLHIAVLNSDPIITRLLLRYGAKIVDDPRFFSITCIAVRNNCEEIVRIFLDHGVNVNETDSQGKTLLHFCVYSGSDDLDSRYNITKLLLERGATTHLQTPRNPLIFEAVKNGHRKTAKLFLDFNANIQYTGPNGDTLLHKAIEKNFDVEFIERILKRNSRINVANHNLLTPLLIACKTKSNNQLEIIKILLHYNANVNCDDHSLMTPLHIVCQAQNLDMVAVLLEKGANVNTTNGEGQTPLHMVCRLKSDITASIIHLLLQNNANIEAEDAKGWAPLFVACYSRNAVAVKSLLDHHADANRTDVENLTPLYIAAKYCKSDSEVVRMLLKHKVNVHCMDKQGNSIIHIIVENCNVELIKVFAQTQINFNSVNKQGNTPLHIAVTKESCDVVENLIKYGANINILNKNNRTPLQKAMKHKSVLRQKLEDYRDCRDSYGGNRFYWEDCYDDDYDTDHYLFDSHRYRKAMKIFKIQAIKLKVAGLKVNKQNLKIVYNFENYSDSELSDQDDADSTLDVLQLEVDCEREIERMITESIGVINMTFYDLLKKNIYFLSRYVKNKKLQQILYREVYDEMFPLYIDIVRGRFRDAKLRYRLMNAAKKYFHSNVCSRLSDDCIDTVFSYLNIKEIKMFIRAIKPLDK